MKLGFPMAMFAAILSLAGLASPALAEEAVSPTRLINLPILPKVPATPAVLVPTVPVQFAPPAEIMQDIAPMTAMPAIAAVDDRDFPTLDAAVAAQPATTNDEELHCLAIGIYFESKGEPLAGQLAVADVILNRAMSGRFPPSVCSVLTQRGQFSFVKGGKVPMVDTAQRAWKTAVAIARVATRDLWDSPAKGALFFHARHVSPDWDKARIASVGNHVFYR